MLEIKNADVGYGKKIVLGGITEGFDHGRLVSIVGTNGAGKSTLLLALAGFIPCRNGEVLIDGIPISKLSEREVALRIAFLAQERRVPDMTVGELVLHGRFAKRRLFGSYGSDDRAAAEAAIDAVGLSSDTHTPLASLSGGMRQRAYIAMAVAQDTDYLLLDEPVAHLDVSHRIDLMRTLKSFTENGRGVVAVMHDLAMAFNHSDEIVVIDGGRTVARAEPCELYRSPIIGEVFGITLQRDENGIFYIKA